MQKGKDIHRNEKNVPARLVVADLCIGYPQKRDDILVASDIEFASKPGELTGVVGVNGIGKSTLLRTLAGVQAPLSGKIEFDGRRVREYTRRELSTLISIVLTEPIPTQNLTVGELIALGRHPYTNWLGTLSSDDKFSVDRAIELLELRTLQDKKCYELSDGQLQKTMIARAIAQDTPFLFLDEPTSHLDLYHKVQILQLLKRIAGEMKKIVIFTTHEIEMAIQLCDRMLIMGPDVHAFGSPAQLISEKRFEVLFPTDTLYFDPEKGIFKIRE